MGWNPLIRADPCASRQHGTPPWKRRRLQQQVGSQRGGAGSVEWWLIYIYCTLYTAEPCWTCIYIYISIIHNIYIYNIHRVVNIYIYVLYIYSSICYEAYKQLSLVGVRRNAIYQSHDPNIQWLTRCKTSWDCQFVYGQYLYMLSLSHNPCMDTHMDFMTFSASFI